MSPPSVIVPVIRPVFTVEIKKVPIRTVAAHIRPFGIIRVLIVNMLTVHPFIKRTAVVKHAIENNLHAPAVDFLCQPGKKRITGFQIPAVRHSGNKPSRALVGRFTIRQTVPLVINYFPVMRIHIIIILYIILVIRR